MVIVLVYLTKATSAVRDKTQLRADLERAQSQLGAARSRAVSPHGGSTAHSSVPMLANCPMTIYDMMHLLLCVHLARFNKAII